MRIAYLPVVSARNVQAAPSYNLFKALHHHAMQLDPNTVFYVLVPKGGEDTNWKDGAAWDLPRTYVLEVAMQESQFGELALVTREFHDRFNERFGDLFFDVILSEKPMLTPMLDQLTRFHIRQKSRQPLIVNRDQFIQDQKWYKCTRVTEILQAVGWCEAPTIFQSPHQAARAVKIAREHLRPAHVKRLTETMKVFPLGIDCDDVDAANMEERQEKFDEVTVNYSHKLFIDQKFVESLKLMDSAFAGGRPIQLQVVTGSSAAKLNMVKKARPYAYITCFGGQNRREFLKKMARAHVFVSNSYYEDFSATVVEQMYTGLLPVLLDAEWSRYLVPDGYPYLFKSMDEGGAMLRYVLDNYAAVAAEWVPRMQEKIRAEFDLKQIVPDMVRWMTELNDKRRTNMGAATAGMVELVEQAYRTLPDEFDQYDLYKAIKQHAVGLDVEKDMESRSTSKWMCVDIMLREHPELIDLGGELVAWRKG